MSNSIRLTNSIREEIMESIMSEYDKTNKAPDLKTAEHNFAMVLWTRSYGKYKKLLDAVPKDFLNTRNAVKYSVNGQVSEAQFLKDSAMPIMLPEGMSSYKAPILQAFTDADKDYSKYDKIRDLYKKWADSRREMQSETNAIIYNTNTTKQLIELWPSAEKFLPAYISNPEKAIQLPALKISRLDERLGIKSEAK